MAANWLDAGPNDCVAAVAEQALRDRFRAVRRYLPLAATAADKNSAPVHQLRVASRRAAAALEIFESLLPSRRVRKIKKELRRIRRSLGDARDLDVLAERLETLAQQGEDGAVTSVLRRISKLRQRAQKPARQVYRRSRRIQLKRQMNRIARRAKHPQELHFGPFARQGMRRVVDDFFQAAAADLSDIENLHELRIVGKQLRYAMEIYAGAFGTAIRDDLYPVFAQVQDKLGAINDHATALRLFGQWQRAVDSKRAARRMRQLLEAEERFLQASSEAFRQWWTTERAVSLKARFDELLPELDDESSLEEAAFGPQVAVAATPVIAPLASSQLDSAESR